MKLSPINTMGFSAKIVRSKNKAAMESEYIANIDGINKDKITISDIGRAHYIKKVKNTYWASVELDGFLHKNEILKKINKLPSIDEIYEDIGNFDDEHIHLYYNANSKKSEKALKKLDYSIASNLTFLELKAENETIDKVQVADWINKLYEYFSHDVLTAYKNTKAM